MIGFRTTVVLCSDLIRARQTADLVARRVVRRSARRSIEPIESETLRPSAHPAEFLRLLPTLRDHASLLAVGHLPHLDRLVSLLLGNPDRQVTAFGKAGAIALEVPDSGRAAAVLRWYLPPKLLRRLGRREE
jgi:phosphohistidine phosphatase SixA